MNMSMERIILEMEKLLNTRLEKEKEKKEYIKDIQDFERLYPEVGKVITDLENKYQETNEATFKEQLDDYLKERTLYETTIQEFTSHVQKINAELEQMPDLPNQVTDYLYDYRETLMELRYLENRVKEESDKEKVIVLNERDEEVEILKEDQKEYQEHITNFKTLEEKIKDVYINFVTEDEYDYDTIIEQVVNHDTYGAANKEDLLKRHEEILAELSKLENEKGRKCHYVFSYNDVRQSKDIPRRVRGRYGKLLAELHKNEEQLKYSLPEIKIDESLYEKMPLEQKREYLANLLLQIEAYTEKSFNKYYTGDKFIPLVYKEIYVEIEHELQKVNKRMTHYTYIFDENLYHKKGVDKKIIYLSKLFRQVVNNYQEKSVSVVLNGKAFKIDERDVPLFQKIDEEYNKIKDILADDIKAKIEQERENKSTQPDLALAKTNYLLNQKELLDKVIFDEAFFNLLSPEEKIKYCTNIINDILHRKQEKKVLLYMDHKPVYIDAKYTGPFTKAVSKLMAMKYDKVEKIDEDYLKELNNSEKRAYFLMKLHDICEYPVTNEVIRTVNNKDYVFDAKYENLADELINCYEDLRTRSSVDKFVQKVKKATNIEKLKKAIKKNAVRIAIGATSLVAVFGLANGLSKKNDKVVNEVAIETLQESNEQPKVENIEVTSKEDTNLDLMQPSLEEDTTLGLNYTLPENTKIYENNDLQTPLNPTYPNDTYRVVAEHYVMPSGEKVTVHYNDAEAEEKIAEIKRAGGVLESVSGVAKSGEEDYAQNNIPTGVFDIEDLGGLTR